MRIKEAIRWIYAGAYVGALFAFLMLANGCGEPGEVEQTEPDYADESELGELEQQVKAIDSFTGFGVTLQPGNPKCSVLVGGNGWDCVFVEQNFVGSPSETVRHLDICDASGFNRVQDAVLWFKSRLQAEVGQKFTVTLRGGAAQPACTGLEGIKIQTVDISVPAGEPLIEKYAGLTMSNCVTMSDGALQGTYRWCRNALVQIDSGELVDAPGSGSINAKTKQVVVKTFLAALGIGKQTLSAGSWDYNQLSSTTQGLTALLTPKQNCQLASLPGQHLSTLPFSYSGSCN